MNENNSLSIGGNSNLINSQNNLLLNKNDKELLSYGANKVGLTVYKKKGWLDYDYVRWFYEGYARVEKSYEKDGKWYSKYNFIDMDGNELLDEFIPSAYSFRNGVARISRGGRRFGDEKLEYNLISNRGEYLLNDWVDFVGEFSEGYSCIEKDGKQNYVDYDGNLLFSERFDSYSDEYRETSFGYAFGPYVNMLKFSEGFAVVKKDSKWNYINKQGQLLLNERSGLSLSGFSGGFGKIIFGNRFFFLRNKKDRFERFIDKNGNYVFSDVLKNMYSAVAVNTKKNSINSCCSCYPFQNGFAMIEVNGNYNFIDINGNLLFKDFDQFHDFSFDYHFSSYHNGCVLIYDKSKKVNVINSEGKLLLDKRYEDVRIGKDGFFVCINKGKSDGRKKESLRKFGAQRNYIDKNGKILFDEWYEVIYANYKKNLFKLKRADGLENISDLSGKLLLSERSDNAYPCDNGFFRVCNPCLIDSNGNKKSLNSLKDMFGNVITNEKQLKKMGYQISDYRTLYNNDGVLVSKDSYDYILDDCGSGWFPVRKDGKGWNFIDKRGNLLF